MIRVANGEWRGIEAYRKRIEAAQLPPASPSDYKNVEVVALGRDSAVVTYERPAPAGATGVAGESLIFRGTTVFTRTAEGWKIAAWHAHATPEKNSAHRRVLEGLEAAPVASNGEMGDGSVRSY